MIRIEFSFVSLKYKKSFCCKTAISIKFPYFSPLWAPCKILTLLNIYLFANNPEITFSALLSFISLTRTPFSDFIFILAAILDFRPPS